MLKHDQRPARGDRIDRAYEVIRDLIVRGQLAPGSRIIETDVATRLGVSRTPVRAALQKLQQEGFVRVSGDGLQARMSVAPLTEEDAHELFAIVAHIEGLASRWAAETGDGRADLVARLRGLNDDLGRIPGGIEGHDDLLATDQALHRAVIDSAGGPRLAALHDAYRPQIERYGRIYVHAFADGVSDAMEEHAALIDAIEAGLGPVADAAMRRNWQNAAERLCRLIRAAGARGNW